MNILRRLFSKRTKAATIDLAAYEVARDPFPHYEALRRRGMVQYLVRHDAWILLGYDDVQHALTHAEVFSNRLYAEVDAVLLAADPPEHTVVRRIVSRYFATDAIDRLIAFSEVYAESLLRPELDVVVDYANALSSAVAAQLLGIDDRDLTNIRLVRGPSAQIADHAALIRMLDEVAPRAGMVERLRGDGLDEPQARSVFRVLWLAATSTTERVIARCVRELLRHDEARDVALVPVFVEEVLRLHPPELIVPRATTRPVQLGPAMIPTGASVYVCLGAANRDPAKFENPAELRLDRPPVRIFTFGSGIHHCIGATLGRRVVQTALRTLLTRAPRFEAAQPLDDVVRWCSKTSSPVARLLIKGAG